MIEEVRAALSGAAEGLPFEPLQGAQQDLEQALATVQQATVGSNHEEVNRALGQLQDALSSIGEAYQAIAGAKEAIEAYMGRL